MASPLPSRPLAITTEIETHKNIRNASAKDFSDVSTVARLHTFDVLDGLIKF